MAQRLVIEPHDPPARRPIGQLVRALSGGDVAAYATDTLYALGCSIEHPRSAERIYRARKMSKGHRLALLCRDVTVASRYAYFNQMAFRVAQRVWPGPFTLILPATREVPKLLLDHRRRTIGLRVPQHPVVCAVLDALGGALLTTSAIGPGGEIAVDADDADDLFGRNIDWVADSGPTPGTPSTILDITDDAIEIVREGLGPLELLES